MYTLETYEWDNIWYEHADDSDSKKRILIVGDSITVGYRGAINAKFGGKVYADAFSTSKALDNPAFLPLLHLMASQSPVPYSAIHFNNGLHGFHLSDSDYADLYEKSVVDIMEKYPNIPLILVLSTPITSNGNPALLDEKNNTVIARNNAVIKIAEKYELQINDLYSLVLGNDKIKSGDGYHFNGEGYDIMAEKCVEILEKVI